MSNAIAGVGTQFKRGDGSSSEQFTAIAEVNDISGPELNREFYDVTSLDSTGGWREFIAGFRDAGNVVLNMNFTLASFSDLWEDYNDSDSHNYQIVLPNTEATVLEFAGYVINLPWTIPTDDKITVAVTIKVDGQPTLTS